MRNKGHKETRKPRTAERGKRYRCANCRKRSPKPLKGVIAPYYCSEKCKVIFKDKQRAALDEMVALNQEMGLY